MPRPLRLSFLRRPSGVARRPVGFSWTRPLSLGCALVIGALSPFTIVEDAHAQATVPRRAPSPAEEKAFASGQEALAAGHADAAEKAFTEGFAVAQDPAFLVKIAEAQEKRGATHAAATTYRRYLGLVPEAADADEIKARADKLEPPASVPAEPSAMPTAPAIPGAVGAAAAPAGAPPAASPPAAGALPRAQLFDLGEVRPEIAQEENPRSALNVAAWIGAGTTVALLGVAAFFAAEASSKKDDVDRYQLFTDENGHPLEYAEVASRFEDARRDGQHDDRVAKGFLWSAAAAGAVTIGLFVADALRTPELPAVRRSAHQDGWRLTLAPAAPTAAGHGTPGVAASLSLALP